MKLAKINHVRCDDRWRAETYVWVTDDMTEERLEELCQAAIKAYWEAEDAAKAEAPPYRGYSPNYKEFPDKTVAEVDVFWAAEHRKYEEWKHKRDKARKPFAEFLFDVGEGAIQKFWSLPDSVIKAEARWGHRHGQHAEYSEVNPAKKDFNYPKKSKDDQWA